MTVLCCEKRGGGIFEEGGEFVKKGMRSGLADFGVGAKAGGINRRSGGKGNVWSLDLLIMPF